MRRKGHAPGPWSVWKGGNFIAITEPNASKEYIDRASGVVARINPDFPDSVRSKDYLANARLIAAAPDLLRELEEVQRSGYYLPEHYWTRINAAIKKARKG